MTAVGYATAPVVHLDLDTGMYPNVLIGHGKVRVIAVGLLPLLHEAFHGTRAARPTFMCVLSPPTTMDYDMLYSSQSVWLAVHD
jgi:hypothetical protein